MLYTILNDHQNGHIYSSHEQTFEHVLRHNYVERPYQVPMHEVSKLSHRIREDQTKIDTSERKISALNDKISQEKAEPRRHRMLKTALRVVGVSLLVLTYAALAASLIGIAAIVGLECANTFNKACFGKNRAALMDERDTLSELKTHQAALVGFRESLKTIIPKSEHCIAVCEGENTKIKENFDISNPKWLNVLRINSVVIREHQIALNIMRAAVAE